MDEFVIVDTRLVMFGLFHKKNDYKKLMFFLLNLLQRAGVSNYSKIILAYDVGASFRKDLFPEYKAQRAVKNKKLTILEKKRLQEFNTFFNASTNLFKLYTNVIAIPNYEADDIASIIANAKVKSKILFITSDSDWAKFITRPQVRMFHIARNKFITYGTVVDEFEVYPEAKSFIDSIIGVPKENVKGVFKLGKKTVAKFFSPYKHDINYDLVVSEILPKLAALIDSKSHMKVPDNKTLEEMFKFNYELFRPIYYKDLKVDDQALFKEQFTAVPSRSIEEINSVLINDFGIIPIITPQEKQFFKLC